MSDIDSLLDISLDDLADLPEFGIYPSGAHRVTIDFESKTVANHPSIEMKMKYVEAIELVDAEATPPAAGAESSVLFMLDNEFGQGALKEVMKPLGEATGCSSVREIMAAAKGMEVVVTTVAKPDKKDPSVMRQNVKKLQVA